MRDLVHFITVSQYECWASCVHIRASRIFFLYLILYQYEKLSALVLATFLVPAAKLDSVETLLTYINEHVPSLAVTDVHVRMM